MGNLSDREKTGTPPVAARHTVIFGALDDLVGHEPERSEAFGLVWRSGTWKLSPAVLYQRPETRLGSKKKRLAQFPDLAASQLKSVGSGTFVPTKRLPFWGVRWKSQRNRCSRHCWINFKWHALPASDVVDSCKKFSAWWPFLWSFECVFLLLWERCCKFRQQQLHFRGRIDPEVWLLDWSIFEWEFRIDPEVVQKKSTSGSIRIYPKKSGTSGLLHHSITYWGWGGGERIYVPGGGSSLDTEYRIQNWGREVIPRHQMVDDVCRTWLHPF